MGNCVGIVPLCYGHSYHGGLGFWANRTRQGKRGAISLVKRGGLTDVNIKVKAKAVYH
jgi:hypothetical protein